VLGKRVGRGVFSALKRPASSLRTFCCVGGYDGLKHKTGFTPMHLPRKAFIGANATIVFDVRSEQYAINVVCAVVTNDVPDHASVIGSAVCQRGWGQPLG